MQYFSGARVQQGYGLGGLFRSIVERCCLWSKAGQKQLENSLFQSVVDFTLNVLSGKNAKQAKVWFESLTSIQTKCSTTEKSRKEETQETSRYFYVNFGKVSTPQFGEIHYFLS